MKKKWIALLGCIFLLKPLLAQTDTLFSKGYGDVVVTANKYDQTERSNSKIMTIVSKTQLQNEMGKTLEQVLNNQAGMLVNGAWSNIGSNLSLYTQGANNGQTLILIDGIPVNDPSTIDNSFDLRFIDLNDVERIEIAKGSQSTLYGSDAIAGVVNIITTPPTTTTQKTPHLAAQIQTGSFNTQKYTLGLTGKWRHADYKVRYAHLSSDGFSSATDSTQTGQYDNDGYVGNMLSVKLGWQTTPSIRLNGNYSYSKYQNGLDLGPFQDDKSYTGSNQSIAAGAGLVFKQNDFSFHFNFQYNTYNRFFFQDSTSLPINAYDKFSTNQYLGNTYFFEGFFTYLIAPNLSLIMGSEFRKNQYQQTYFSVALYGNTTYSNITPQNQFDLNSIYASLHYTLPKSNVFNIDLGGRINNHSVYGTNYTYTLNPKIELSKSLYFLASVATGFKAPSLYQIASNPMLLPETSLNYEAGFLFSKPNKTLKLLYFNRKLTNGIGYYYTSVWPNYNYYNLTQQLAQGLELDAQMPITATLFLNTNYSLLIGQETAQSRTNIAAIETYPYLLKRPKHMIKTNLTQKIYRTVTLSLSGQWVSERYDIGPYNKQDVLLSAYFLLSTSLVFKPNNLLSLYATVQNLNNAHFYESYGYNALQRSLTAGIRLNL